MLIIRRIIIDQIELLCCVLPILIDILLSYLYVTLCIRKDWILKAYFTLYSSKRIFSLSSKMTYPVFFVKSFEHS